MKVYLFYRVATKTMNIDPPTLYAFTENKELADKFELTRDMKQFYLKKVKMNEEEFNKFRYDFGHCNLRLSGFTTRIKDFGKDIMFLVTTEKEEESVYLRADDILKELGKYTDMEAGYFNTEVMKALNQLNYYSLYKFYSNDENYLYSGINPIGVNHFDLNLTYDMLNLFFFFYGDTLKLKVD